MTRYAVASEETARRNLGNAIRFYREQRRFTQHRVADICSTSLKTVDAWERGDEVPPDWQWAKLINVMHRDLREYRALRMRAQLEQRADDDEGTQSDRAPLTTPLGDKLARELSKSNAIDDVDDVDDVEPETRHEATAPANATPVRPLFEPSELARPLPQPAPIVPLRVVATPQRAKARQQSTREQREEFVRNVLRSRPDAKLGGADGIGAMLERTYGRSMTYELFYRLRDEVRAECRAPHVHQHEEQQPVAKPAPLAAPAPPAAPVSTHDPKQEIAAVLQLLRETVPNLASLVVTTEAGGELRCKYKLREVKITEVESDLTV